ncbi:adenylate/guanylate cyclase domain-containing protein [Muriicola sp. SD30]|uniref:adenylate/guanylate cyclase domain-containing protein n=1 Tax=Muriicola sp. SD30 TaxID=3240936 RepID=UPI00350F2E8A
MRQEQLLSFCSRARIFRFLWLVLFLCQFGYAQNQKIADSLVLLYESGNYEDDQLINILSDIAAKSADPDQSLVYSEILLKKSQELDSTMGIYRAYLQQGNAYETKGDLSESLNSYFKAVDQITTIGNKKELAKTYIAIAGVYAGMDNRKNLIEYYSNAIDILKNVDQTYYAISMENLGDVYLTWQQPDSALLLFARSGPIFEELGEQSYLAYNKGNKGLAYAQKGQYKKAESFIGEAIQIHEEVGNYRAVSVYLTGMSDIYAANNDWDSAFNSSLRALKMAQNYGLKAEISLIYLKLSELFEQTGYYSASLKYYRNHIAYRDSVQNISEVQEMANNELARKQIEVDLLNQRRKTQRVIVIATAIALFFILLLAISLYRRNIYIKKTNAVIEKEKERSEKLLLNILPEKTANELKEFGKVKANKFESVSVLFTDFISFTAHSERTDPELLVNSISVYFSAFDDIIENYGLEKIKTIGDSYMCAGGLPEPLEDHAVKMVKAAFEFLAFVKEMKSKRKDGEPSFEMRVGINTGPVVAGVVGHDKFSYDIWGDTVNVAARMEQMSEKGKINISESTYKLIKDDFECELRGEFEVRNKGRMKMYFVNEKQKKSKSAVLSGSESDPYSD